MHLPAGHHFPANKYALLAERVEQMIARGAAITLSEAPEATAKEVLRVHTAEYLRKVRHGELTEAEQRAIGFPWSEAFVRRSLRSTGATVAAAKAVAEQGGWGAHLAGGTHHAFADRGQGFCVFNDVAVAARMLQADYGVARILVLDCDVHQGNGTAAIFAGDPGVYTMSIHGAKNFPRVKEASDLDVPLDDACGDAEYMDSLRPAVDRALAEAQPEWVFFIGGADPYKHDRYGRMKLTRAGLRQRDRDIAERLAAEALPVVVAMGGGYARDVDAVAHIYAATIEELARRAP